MRSFGRFLDACFATLLIIFAIVEHFRLVLIIARLVIISSILAFSSVRFYFKADYIKIFEFSNHLSVLLVQNDPSS